MSNTTVIDSFLSAVNLIRKNTSLYGYSIMFVFGNIGLILNILILTQRKYRQNSCSCYILASTIMNLFIINIVVLLRILTGFNIDPTRTSWFFCKFRTYMVLACVDRWAMTSRIVRQRAFTRRKISNILIPLVAIGWSLSFLYVSI